MARIGQYRNVAVPIDNYGLLREIAQKENRSIAMQLKHMIEETHYNMFPNDYDGMQLAKQVLEEEA